MKHFSEVAMRENNPIFNLQLYGLEEALTDQDDPRLWAAALVKHWPAPDDPNLDVSRLSFGIGRRPGGSAGPAVHGPSGIVIIEVWGFQRADAEHLRAVRSDRETRSSSYPEHILEISRPSAGSRTAFVHAGGHPAPLVGYGETKVWIQQDDGSWVETDEVVSSWIS